ncbi:MAG: hypothetical protein JST29_02460 [Bacteroidetes bacterium]|nr:hypothetical protein [Bacteroidota bacterium]MBS1591226.1 hypothetical protein [Bacteroidota bacterium]
MESDFRNKQRKSYTIMRSVYDLGMGLLIVCMGLFLLLGDRLKVDAIYRIVMQIDPLLKYIFGGMCLLYGGYRLYRGIKKDY